MKPFKTIEEAQEAYLEQEEVIKQINSDNENLKQNLAEKEQRILSLQEANQKLFLRVTNEPEREETEESLSFEDLAEKFLGGK